MIEIDGKEGGGQIVRTAVAMSALTGKAVNITNIRGARPKPGLKTQHMQGISAVGKLCNAKLKGLELGSQELEFTPGELTEKDLTIVIPTAGAIGLILQALMIPTTKLKTSIKIEIKGGGTWNKWAPPVLYFEKVLFPILGEESEINIIRNGFYPKGGAQVTIIAKPWSQKHIEITDKGKIKDLKGISVAAEILQKRNVAERQAKAAKDKVTDIKIENKYVDAMNAGSGILLWANCENSILSGDAIGERGKMAEEVGKEAAENLKFDLENGAVDFHTADMLLPYMALAGTGKIKTSKITNHIKTNISVIERFLDISFKINEDEKTISL